MTLLVSLAVTAACCVQLLLLLPMTQAEVIRREPVGNWQAGERWCRVHGLGGLFPLPGGESAMRRRLGSRVATGSDLRPGRCYWAAPESTAAMEELRWTADSSSDSGSGEGRDCLCAAVSERGSPRLRLVNCHRRLPFLCRLQLRKLPAKPITTTTKAPKHASAVRKPRPPPPQLAEFVPDETADDPDGMVDEPVDHAKFPLSGLLPQHLPLTLSISSAATPIDKSSATWTTPAVSNNETTTSGAPGGAAIRGGQLGLLSEAQRSEFITLLVLYSIVGVVCCVLLILCVVRCCRGRCGRVRIRYVKQVDADDIPRFMPSSWA